MTSTVTSDFRHEFEQVHTDWLRVRFQWYCGVIGGLNLLIFLIGLSILALAGTERVGIAALLVDAAQVAIFVAPLVRFLRMAQAPSRERVILAVSWMIVANGLIQLAPAALSFLGLIEASPGVVRADSSMGPGANWMFAVFISHLAASLFIPWSPREAIRPLIPLLVVNAIGSLLGAAFGADAWVVAGVAILVSPIIGVPGVAIAWWRTGRFREKFHLRALRGRYSEMKRELTDARRIHEALFPDPIRNGAVRFEYRYEPMRQIGGDFLFAHNGAADVDGASPLSVVLIDVTGHGIPAALTVNRLHGELERLFGEDPDISPGDVLTALNSYVHFTLANHSVYATAFCLRVDPRRHHLEYASGGHPPAFICTIDGRIDCLGSTSFVLGACHGEDFDPGQRAARFGLGDALLLYTDGATEARDARGKMLTVDGLQRLIASLEPRAVAEGGWAGAVLGAVERFRHGPPADDTLVVEVFRPMSGTASRAS